MANEHFRRCRAVVAAGGCTVDTEHDAPVIARGTGVYHGEARVHLLRDVTEAGRCSAGDMGRRRKWQHSS